MSSAEYLGQGDQFLDQENVSPLDVQLRQLRHSKVGQQYEVSGEIADTLITQILESGKNAHEVFYEFRKKAPTKLEIILGDPTENERMQGSKMQRTRTATPHLRLVSTSDADVVTEDERINRTVIQSHGFERIRLYMTTIKKMMQRMLGKEDGFVDYRVFRDTFTETMSEKMKAYDELVKLWKSVLSSQTEERTYEAIDAEMKSRIGENKMLLTMWEAEMARQDGKPMLGQLTHDDFTYDLEEKIALLAEALEAKNDARQTSAEDVSILV
ncbi:MAG: hypothetical protein KBA40_00845 [Candidatus Peribacteraceae bacterium]|nr:hypothetical protein [Candidatus Peribacteraceae bacterium]MBP9850202.1 hypothetical protein [Candidatus Peribacteraceae bacterium]